MPNSNAIVPTSQLSLIGFATLNGDSKAFNKVEKVSDKGAMSQVWKLLKRADIEAATGLTGDELDDYIMSERDGLKRQLLTMVSHMASDPNWTATNVKANRTKNGKMSCTFRLDKIMRELIDDEKCAAYMGVPLEQVREARKRQLAAIAAQAALDAQEAAIDVNAGAPEPQEPEAPQAPAPEAPAKPGRRG
jgi:hypothetical protein